MAHKFISNGARENGKSNDNNAESLEQCGDTPLPGLELAGTGNPFGRRQQTTAGHLRQRIAHSIPRPGVVRRSVRMQIKKRLHERWAAARTLRMWIHQWCGPLP